MKTTRLGSLCILLAALIAAACVSGSPAPPPETTDPATGEPALRGSRYETMRVLARRLADSASAARDEAFPDRARRTGEETPETLTALVNRARDFHRRLDNYADPLRYVRSEVRELDGLVREIDSRMRYGRASSRADRSWRDVLDVMDRMNRLAAGEDVDLPATASESGPLFPTPSSDETWRSGSGSGSVLRDREMDDFRRMARELAVRATLASEGADRAGARDSASEVIRRDIQEFRTRARDLERRADASTLDRRDVRSLVEGLHEDARRIDRELRDRGLYTAIWADWTEVLLLARRMADVTRG